MIICHGRSVAFIRKSTLVAVLFALATAGAQAQVSGCNVTTVALGFGSYDVSAVSPLITSSRIEIRCASRTTLTIGIDGGNSLAGSTGSRALRHVSSSDVLSYVIYQDTSLSQIWGNGLTSAGRSVVVTGAQTVFAYGVLPAGQDVRFGEYRDALSVVVLP